MSLKDRLRSKKEAKILASAESCDFKISIKKVTEAISKVKSSTDLGNIVKEFAKFLNTLSYDDANITFSGNFDLGQKTLLNCILSNFLEDNKKTKDIYSEEVAPKTTESKLIRRRKSIKAKLEETNE